MGPSPWYEQISLTLCVMPFKWRLSLQYFRGDTVLHVGPILLAVGVPYSEHR